ncbi:MAG TPA: hypothetical protein VMR74_10905 [Gammaproteobacteria bacterium]|nr:hypothetical protein [Gammaproteobacteria bacterium]
MIKAALSLIAGGLLGAGVVYAIIDAGESDSTSFVESVADFALGRDGPEDSGVASVAENLAAYRAVAGETDLADLARALESAAAAAWSPARDLEIDALLARLADLAPGELPALAWSLGLETRFLADSYIYVAEADPAAAIRELASIESRRQRLDVALALLEVVGDDGAGLERVSAGLADDDRARLGVAWIAARAEYDPYGAFREAQSLGRSEAEIALERIGTVWAAQDPSSAIAQADLLAGPLRSRYLGGVFREWARLDANGYLAWLESVPAPPTQAVIGLQLLAGSHPDLVMSIADGLSGNIGQAAITLATQAIAEADPDAAMARAEGMLAGPERDALLVAIGSVLAGRDPDAALAWASSVSASPRNLMTQVVLSIVQTNPERAIELLDDPPPGVNAQSAMSIVTSMTVRDPETAQALADKLVASDSIQSANALQTLVGNWMRQDPERALDWVLAHETGINATVFGTAAQAMANADPAAAASYLERIPAEHRSVWIAQVAGPYGISDPNAALAWIAQFQGQEIYDNAFLSVITASAQTDARSAAQAVSQASPAVQSGAAPQVAALLAREDPQGAARWAESLTDEQARIGAIGATVSMWAAADFSGAKSYALGLDRGATRDQALGMLTLRSAQSSSFDRSLLDAFSSDRATQDALAGAIPMISRNDPEEARALLERVTSGEARRLIEEQIEALANSAPGFF